MQQYLNIAGHTLNDLYSAVNFPDSPDRYSVNPSFQSELVRYDCLSVGLCVSSQSLYVQLLVCNGIMT